jgi:hypothetical protein
LDGFPGCISGLTDEFPGCFWQLIHGWLEVDVGSHGVTLVG